MKYYLIKNIKKYIIVIKFYIFNENSEHLFIYILQNT